MRKKEWEFDCFISAAKLEKLLRGEADSVVTKIGAEHDGHQIVLRLSVKELWGKSVNVNAKAYVWDHGGDLTRRDDGKA